MKIKLLALGACFLSCISCSRSIESIEELEATKGNDRGRVKTRILVNGLFKGKKVRNVSQGLERKYMIFNPENFEKSEKWIIQKDSAIPGYLVEILPAGLDNRIDLANVLVNGGEKKYWIVSAAEVSLTIY